MAVISDDGMKPWHDGEHKMHDLLHVPYQDNPFNTFLGSFSARSLVTSPLVALGTLDEQGRPWTSIWGGEAGFAQPLGSSIIGIRNVVDTKYDPVVQALLGKDEEVRAIKEGRMVAGLGINLATRRRVKLYGRMVAGSLENIENTEAGTYGQAQLVVRVDESFGNCPKYLNSRNISPQLPSPVLKSSDLPLSQEAVDLVAKSDSFFISSSNHTTDMDVNIRGGPPGFVRLVSNDLQAGTVIVYPEYSGNRLYQTLGNLQVTPLAGLAFPNFDTGDVLYVTGKTDVLIGKDADALLPHSPLAVRITLTGAAFVANGLSFRGHGVAYSPYNPHVRYLRTEREAIPTVKRGEMATLIAKTKITPTISRYRFSLSSPKTWLPGQYAALSFADDLDSGYSHMRDDDPQSLNDDFVRSFTVSSSQKSSTDSEFEITVRIAGAATRFLSHLHERAAVEIPFLGFAGTFRIDQKSGENVAFVAGGIGITPLLGQVDNLDLKRVRLFWSLSSQDVNLAKDVFLKAPALAENAVIFITGAEQEERTTGLKEMGVKAVYRRIVGNDLIPEKGDSIVKWYLCAGLHLRKQLLSWLEGREVAYEDFGY